MTERKWLVYMNFGTYAAMSVAHFMDGAKSLVDLPPSDYLIVICARDWEEVKEGKRALDDIKAEVAQRLKDGMGSGRDLRENYRVEWDYFPQKELFAEPDLAKKIIYVSHCGASSCVEALQAGIPLVSCPTQEEQRRNGRCMADLGVAIDLQH